MFAIICLKEGYFALLFTSSQKLLFYRYCYFPPAFVVIIAVSWFIKACGTELISSITITVAIFRFRRCFSCFEALVVEDNISILCAD